MIRNDKLRALHISNLAGRVLDAIDKFLANEVLSADDLNKLKEGREFFKLAKRGRDLSRNYQLSADIAEASSTYGVVLRATGYLAKNSHHFRQSKKDVGVIFDQYINTITDIIQTKNQSQEYREPAVILRDLFEFIQGAWLKKSLSNLKDVVTVIGNPSMRSTPVLTR